MIKNRQLSFVFLPLMILISAWVFLFLQNKDADQDRRNQIVRELVLVEEWRDQELINVQQQSIKDQLAKRQTELEKAIEDAIEWDKPIGESLKWMRSSKQQYDLLKSIYVATKDESLLSILFQISLDLRNYDFALDHLWTMQKLWLSDSIDVQTYFYALFNSAEIDFTSLARFQKMIEEYSESNLISKDDRIFYYSLIALSRWDVVEYEKLLQQLQLSKKYSEWFDLYEKAIERYESFVDTPEYYLKGLLSIWLFQKGWYRQVQHISRQIILEDDSYLLWYQLNAYSSVMLSDWDEAFTWLEYLKSKDQPNKELYLYLWWIVLYNQWKYQEAIFSLSQLKEQKFHQDVLRYKYLAFEKIWDSKWMMETLSLLINGWWLNVYDYYTIFDSLFFKESTISIEAFSDQLLSLVTSCYDNIEEDFVYICLYWKAWMNIYLWDYTKAYQYLTYASQWFPDRDIYERLGDLAVLLDKTQEATKWYIKAITSSSFVDQQEDLRNKIKQLME